MMQITVTFDSIEEMMGFTADMAGKGIMAPSAEGEKTNMPKTKEVKQTVQAVKSAVKEDRQTVQEEKQELNADPIQAEPEDKTPEYTLEDVRARLAGLNKAGKRSEVKQLLASFGADKLSEIPKEKYTELMEKAGGI